MIKLSIIYISSINAQFIYKNSNLTLKPYQITLVEAAYAIQFFLSKDELYFVYFNQLLDGSVMKQAQNMRKCLGTASAYEVHIDEVDDLKELTSPIDLVR